MDAFTNRNLTDKATETVPPHDSEVNEQLLGRMMLNTYNIVGTQLDEIWPWVPYHDIDGDTL